MTTFFKFSALALAAHQALKPTSPPPQAEADIEQSLAVMGHVVEALAVSDPTPTQCPAIDAVVWPAEGECAVTGEAVMAAAATALVGTPDLETTDDERICMGTQGEGEALNKSRAHEGEVTARNRRLAGLIGSRIRAAREAGNIGQFELSRVIGHATPTQPSLWEAGKRLVPLAELPGLAKALGVSVDFLIGLDNDMDAGPERSRRGLLVQCLRDQLEAVASNLADAVLESGGELEGALRTTRLLSKCADVQHAVNRFRAANAASFEDMPAGALLVRSVRELAEAAVAVGVELDGVGHRRERAARKAKMAMVAGVP